ncbi:MAG TPA: GNAT family protein [Nitrosospira sp.]|nr:GNAT family protein [Nitrosospira sp.]
MTFAIRRALESDAASLIDLRRWLFEETSFMLWEPAEFKQTEDDERARIIRLNRQPNSVILLAEAGMQLVGVLSATGDDRKQLRQTALLSIGVVKSHWSQGIGSRMIQDAINWSLAAGIKRLELTVHTSNLRAISVYMRYGFEVEGLRRSSLLVNGRYINEYLMALIHEG